MNKVVLRYLLILLVIGTAVAAVFVFLFMRPLPVEVAQPANNVPVKVFGLGTVEGRILSKIGFEVSAALVELDADEGEQVKKGDVLARLHNAEQEASVTKARAGIINAKAVVKMKEAAAEKARAVLVQKKQINRRRQDLAVKNTVSVEAAEEAQMEEDTTAAELTVALSDVEVVKAALENAKAQHEYEKVLLGHHILRAPYDAIVVERHNELGSVLAAGEPVFTLVAPETVWTLAYIDEARAGEIRVGQPAEVRLRSQPRDMFKGHVARISIESDRVSEERRVYVACGQCPENFHLGEQAEVFITTTVLNEVFLIPEIAVEGFDGVKGTVWTIEDKKLHRRNVTFGHRTLDSRLEIAEGLPSEARVVTVLQSRLREGRAAKMLESATP